MSAVQSLQAVPRTWDAIGLSRSVIHYGPVPEHETQRAERIADVGPLPTMIAHEIRQPLSAMTTFVEASLRWLNQDEPNLQEACRALERATQAANRAASLVERIGKLTSRSAFDFEAVPLDAAAGEAVDEARFRVPAFAHTVRVEPAEHGMLARCDGQLLRQVLVNLLANAMHAVSDLDRPEIEVRYRREAGGLLIVVADNGPGFSAEARLRAMSSFYSSRPGGTGAGLYFCRAVVLSMGGTLDLGQSDQLGGAEVTIRLA